MEQTKTLDLQVTDFGDISDIFTIDELFDDLASQLNKQPDDELALAGISNLIAQAYETGDIAFSISAAARLGEMAMRMGCGGHLEDLVNAANDAATGHNKNDSHDHSKHSATDAKANKESKNTHDAKKCSACKAGRSCRKK